MKIAIVHDDFMQWGGAERVLKALVEIWPNAPVYTALFDPEIVQKQLPNSYIVSSFLQNRLGRKLYQQLFFLHPLAFEDFDLNEYDVVISSSSRFAKSVITRPGSLHICYCHNPSRFLWTPEEYISHKSFNPLTRPIYQLLLPPLLSYLRLHDYTAAQQVDHFISNSGNTSRQIEKYYDRSSQVVYPFVDLERFNTRMNSNRGEYTNGLEFSRNEKYYLIVSRLSPQKRIDIAVEAFNQLGEQLVVIGEGPQRNYLESIAKNNIKFLGYLRDEEIVKYIQNCEAFLYPQKEDFGITALEAQAAGTPVIAYGVGGATETVIDKETGIFFNQQTPESLNLALDRFEKLSFSREALIENAYRFRKENFKRKFAKLVESYDKSYT